MSRAGEFPRPFSSSRNFTTMLMQISTAVRKRCWDELDATVPDTDTGHSSALTTLCEMANAAIDIVNVWIKNGGIIRELSGQGAE